MHNRSQIHRFRHTCCSHVSRWNSFLESRKKKRSYNKICIHKKILRTFLIVKHEKKQNYTARTSSQICSSLSDSTPAVSPPPPIHTHIHTSLLGSDSEQNIIVLPVSACFEVIDKFTTRHWPVLRRIPNQVFPCRGAGTANKFWMC